MLSIVFRLVRFTSWLTIHQCHLQVNSESKCFCPFDLITIFHNDSIFIGIFFFLLQLSLQGEDEYLFPVTYYNLRTFLLTTVRSYYD